MLFHSHVRYYAHDGIFRRVDLHIRPKPKTLLGILADKKSNDMQKKQKTAWEGGPVLIPRYTVVSFQRESMQPRSISSPFWWEEAWTRGLVSEFHIDKSKGRNKILPGLQRWQDLLRISTAKLFFLLSLTFSIWQMLFFLSLPMFLMELEINTTFLFTS